MVSHKISVNLMPFDVLVDFVKVTGETVLVPFTVQLKNRDITFVNKDGVQRGVVNIFGRVTTLSGHIAQTFEDTVQADIPAELLAKSAENSQVYWKAVPLRSGPLSRGYRGQGRERRPGGNVEQRYTSAGLLG